MKHRFFTIFILLFFLNSCKKENSQSVACLGCNYTGAYQGNFHSVAACYGCPPYLDTMFSGLFSVDTIGVDSIVINRDYDSYSWRWAVNDSGEYSRWGCCTVGESFAFRQPDTLTYFYNNGGSGGYFNQTFAGKKQ